MDSNAFPSQTAPMSTATPTEPLPFIALASLDEEGFVDRFGAVVEHSAWVARRAWGLRPFSTRDDVFRALASCILQASPDEQLALLRAHPELAGREASEGTMTSDSNAEQGRLGLMNLGPGDWKRLQDLNRRYREQFGIPFVVALRLHGSLASVFDEFEQRLRNVASVERDVALGQVCEVMRGRLMRTLGDDARHAGTVDSA